MWDKISKQSIRNIIAVITLVGCFILLYLFTMKPIPEGNKDVLLTLGGVLFGGGVGGVFGYFFGASKNAGNEKPDQ